MSNIRIDNIAPSAGGTYRNAPRGIAAAWVNFNGTKDTPAIRDSVQTSVNNRYWCGVQRHHFKCYDCNKTMPHLLISKTTAGGQ
jgi:hypothetical protein